VDFSRLRQGELIAGIAGAALIICMFLPWYGIGVSGVEVPSADLPDVPGIDVEAIQEDLQAPEVDDDANAWDSLTDFDGFLIAAAGVAGIALALLAAAGRKVNLGGLPRGCVTAALGALAIALIVWRLLAQPSPGADYEFGIFLGLAAAVGVTVGATMALREGGFEPLPAVAGGRTRAAPAASAPVTTTRRATAAPKRKSSGSRSTSSRKKSSGSRTTSSRSKSGGGRSRSSGTRKRSSGGRK
jgi:uncharacterized membrane protein YgcG